MLIRNIQLKVTQIDQQQVELTSELGQKIIIAKDFLESVKVGDTIFLAADKEPVKISEHVAKDILNQLIGDNESK